MKKTESRAEMMYRMFRSHLRKMRRRGVLFESYLSVYEQRGGCERAAALSLR